MRNVISRLLHRNAIALLLFVQKSEFRSYHFIETAAAATALKRNICHLRRAKKGNGGPFQVFEPYLYLQQYLPKSCICFAAMCACQPAESTCVPVHCTHYTGFTVYLYSLPYFS